MTGQGGQRPPASLQASMESVCAGAVGRWAVTSEKKTSMESGVMTMNWVSGGPRGK